MSTTIDSLDIQIRSSAGTAAVNIDKLADSLAKLKANGKISTVANNLKKLKESLDGLKSVNSGIQALEKFGRVFSKMSSFTANVSGFSKAMNSLKKLPSLAGELKSVDFSGFSAQMQALESGMSSLSGVANPKGLTTSLNALKKIPEITSSLNPQIIDEFGDKIEKLAAKLAPLATQIDKVGSGFAKLPSQVSKTVTATNRMEQATRKATNANNKHSESLNKKSINLMATIQNLQEITQAIHFVADGIGNVMNDAMQWDGIQFRFGRAFGEDAEEVLAYSEKLTEKLGINQQQFMQYSSMYGSLLSGFGMAQEQVTTISVGLAELSYDIWAAYNDRYQSLEDASEAVRSAITGEIEPIRNAGIALTEASMQEYLDSLGMAHIKMANLSEAQKSEVRYATMVNAAMNQGIVGTYAAEMNTAEGVMRNLAMQTKTLAQNFGSLFIPVLMKVIPYVTAFVQILTDATRAIAGFFGVELQKINWGSSAGGLGGVADSATDAAGALGDAGKEAKKLQQYTMGFDELNVIDPDKGSASGGAGGAGGVGSGGSLGLDLDTLWDESVFAKAKQDVDKIKDKLMEMLGVVKDIAIIIGSWRVAGKLLDFVDWLKDPKSVGDFKKKAGLTLMIAGLSFAFDGAYDMGKEGANIKNVLKTAIGSAMGIAGSLLVFGTGPLGWTIGIGAALAVTITGFTLGFKKKQILEDQKEHFGDYIPSDEELQEMVDNITTSGVSLKLDLYVDQQQIVAEAEEALKASIQELQKKNMQLEIGIEVPQKEYSEAIDSFLSNAKIYLEEKQTEYVLAIAVTLEGTDTGAQLTTFTNTFFGESQEKLKALGNDLKNVVATGFKDGEWIPDKLEEAIKIQEEIKEVLEYVSEKEYQAKMTALKLDASGTELTFESMQQLLTKANENITEKMKNLEEVRIQQIQIAEMAFDQAILDGKSKEEAQVVKDKMLADIQAEFLNSKWELETGTVTFGLDTIKNAYSTELAQTVPFLQQSTETLFTQGSMAVLPEQTYTNVSDLMLQLSDAYRTGFENMDISSAAKGNIEKLLTAMKPSVEDMNKIAEESRKAGKTVPEEVAKGLADAAQIAAITGNLEAQNYLIGQKLSTDQSFLEVLATAEGAGAEMNKHVKAGLADNLTLVTDEATGVITGIKNAMTGEITEITPTLYDNMKELGINLPEGLYEGADAEMKREESSWKDWALWPWNWFKKENDINSPSKLFFGGGENLSSGLFNGSDSKMQSLKSSWQTWSVWPWNWFKTENGVTSGDSSVFKTLGEKLSGGLFAGSDADLKAKESSWKTWSLLPWNWFKTENGIQNGNSTEFNTLGKKIAAGLFGGVDKNTKQNDYTGVFGQLSGWFSSTFGIDNGEESVFAKLGKSLIGNLKAGLSTAWNNLKLWWEKLELPEFKIKMPHISWSSTPATGWIATTLEALGLPSSIPKMKIEWYANGGFPDMGQMFIAREAGPELVGSINGRTAVANNDQIVAAVSQGVYSAVMAAMGNNNNSGEQNINVYLDGKQIYASVEKTKAERGRTLMGNQLGYGY